MEIKYTSDGKKVRVVGKLNAQETIVQEIFCDGENEIPSGENFVVKSVHDKPVISWKEKEIKRLDDKYVLDSEFYKNKDIELRKRTSQLSRVLTETYNIEKYFSEDKLKYLDLFLSGGITHYLETSWGIKIVEFSKACCGCDHNNMKLLTLYGSSSGELNWRLCNYSDGSGGNSHVIPCTSYEEALIKAQEHIDEHILKNDSVSNYILDSAKKYDLNIPKKYIQKNINEKIRVVSDVISSKQGDIDKKKKELEILQKIK